MKRVFSGIKTLFAGLIATQLIIGNYTLAREPYHVDLTVDSTTAKVSAPNLVDLKRNLRTSAIEDLIPIYTPNSPLSLDINLRGILALASFAANSTTLVVEIPNAGITETFTGATRDDSVALFKDYILDAGAKHKLLKAYARHSPIDPIAGNPNSLMANMAEADYLLGRLYPQSGCNCCLYSQPVLHEFQSGTSFVRGFSKGYETSSATLPLRYSYSPCRTWALIVDAPLTYNKTGGASSLSGSAGVGFRYPLTCKWSITPVLRVGTGLSLDLATGTLFCSVGATSSYDHKVKPGVVVFSLINYIGYTTSANIWTTGVNWNYNLHNFIFKNGFTFTTCEGVKFYNRVFNAALFFEDTTFTRDRLYIMHYDEVGISINTCGLNKRISWDSLTLGLSYQFGERDYYGYRFNVFYQF